MLTTIAIGLAVVAVFIFIIFMVRREPEPTHHIFYGKNKEFIVLLANGKFKYKTADGYKIGRLAAVLQLCDDDTKIDIMLAHAHVHKHGYPSYKTFVSRQQAAESLRVLRQLKERNMSKSKPRPTGRTYRARNGRTYQQMSNGQYAYNNNGSWDFITYMVLFDMLGSSDQSQLTRDHQAYTLENGAPSDTPASSVSVDSSTPSSGSYDSGSSSGGSSPSCGSSSCSSSSCGGGGCGGG